MRRLREQKLQVCYKLKSFNRMAESCLSGIERCNGRERVILNMCDICVLYSYNQVNWVTGMLRNRNTLCA